jgi:hypothetical protein
MITTAFLPLKKIKKKKKKIKKLKKKTFMTAFGS